MRSKSPSPVGVSPPTHTHTLIYVPLFEFGSMQAYAPVVTRRGGAHIKAIRQEKSCLGFAWTVTAWPVILFQ